MEMMDLESKDRWVEFSKADEMIAPYQYSGSSLVYSWKQTTKKRARLVH